MTMAILSCGIMLVYKSFFISLNHIQHVTNRLIASNLIDKRFSDIEMVLKSQGVLILSAGPETQKVTVLNKEVDFHFDTTFTGIGTLKGLYEVNMTISWREGAKQVSMMRSAYLNS